MKNLDNIKTQHSELFTNIDATLRNRIITEYISEDDFILATYLSKNHNYAISFRAAGADTLKRLAEGAGPKPHSILDKSIKQQSLDDICVESNDTTMFLATDSVLQKIMGLVPVWYTEQEIGKMGSPGYQDKKADFFMKGLYLTSAGQTAFRGETLINALNSRAYISMDTLRSALSESTPEQTSKFEYKFFITGDYDTHDLVSFTSHTHTVASGQVEEKRILDGLNICFDKKGVPNVFTFNTIMDYKKHDYSRIQHGPQYSYIAYMIANESAKPITPKIAAALPPVAMCDRGVWSIVSHRDQLSEVYVKQLAIKIKNTWTDDTAAHEFIEYRQQKLKLAGIKDVFERLTSGLGKK